MKKSRWLLVVLANTARADPALHAEAPTLTEQFHESLREKAAEPLAAGSFTDWLKLKGNHGKGCGFPGFCDYLMRNLERPYLYQSAEGAIPNFYLTTVEDIVADCQTAIHTPDPAFVRMQADLVSSTVQRAAAGAFDAFNRAAQDAGEQDVFPAIYGALQNSLAEGDTFPAVTEANATATRPLFEQRVKALEKRADKAFSEPIRKLFIDYLMLSYHSRDPELVLGRSKFWNPVLTNPFTHPQAFYDRFAAGGAQRLAANQKLYRDAVTRTERIYLATRDAIIQILRRRQAGERGAEDWQRIENLIQRVMIVDFNAPKLPSQLAEQSCNSPNAFYSPITNTFTICPQLLEFPEATLKAIIAHELTHAIDPCTSASTLYTMPRSEHPLFQRDSTEAPSADPEAKIVPVSPVLTHADTSQGHLVDLNNLLTGSPGAAGWQRIDGLLRKDYPLKKVVACLAAPDSVQAKAPEPAALKKAMDAEIAEYRKMGGRPGQSLSLTELIEARRKLPSMLSRYGACNDLSISQLGEATADWMASQVMELDLAATPPSRRRERAFQASSLLASLMTCPNSTSGLSLLGRRALEQNGCASNTDILQARQQLANIRDVGREEHPRAPDRTDRIFLAAPGMRRALGCSWVKGVNYCE